MTYEFCAGPETGHSIIRSGDQAAFRRPHSNTALITRSALLLSAAPLAIFFAAPAAAQDACVTISPGNVICEDNGLPAIIPQSVVSGQPVTDVVLEEDFEIDTSGSGGDALFVNSFGALNITQFGTDDLIQGQDDGIVTISGATIAGDTNITLTGTIIGNANRGLAVTAGTFATAVNIDTTLATVTGGQDGMEISSLGTGVLNIVTGDVTGTNQYGINASNFTNGTDMAVDTSAGNVSGGTAGILANHSGTGVLSIVTGNVTGGTLSGMYAYSVANSTGLTIDSSAGSVGGALYGIFAYHSGTGALSITTSDVTGTGSAGIRARTNSLASTDLSIDSTAGTVSGGSNGINAGHVGTGALSITTADVTGTTTNGISAATGGNSLAIDSSAGSVSGNANGIRAIHTGTGYLVIDTANVTGSASEGIYAYGSATVADIAIDSTAGSVSGGTTGIRASHAGTGDLAIDTANVTGSASEGISAYGSATVADIAIDSTAGSVSGGTSGIRAIHDGTGALSITTADVTGTTQYGIAAASNGADLTVDSSAGTVTGANGGISSRNYGSGSTTITTADVNADSLYGIYARDAADGLTIDTTGGNIISGGSGIRAVNDIAGSLAVTTGDVTASAGSAIGARNTSSLGGIAIDTSAGSVNGSGWGIVAYNQGAGDMDIVTADVSGGSQSGIRVTDTSLDNNVTINTVAGSLTGETFGIDATKTGAGDLTIVTADVTSNIFDGVYAVLSTGSDLTIDTSAGDVVAGQDGLFAVNNGTGSLVISAGDVSSVDFGIYAQNTGSNALSITVDGDIESTNNTGIQAYNSGSSLSIDTSEGTVIADDTGIAAVNFGNGPLTITTGNVTGSGAYGIFADQNIATGGIIIDSSGGSVVGNLVGVRAEQNTAGNNVITVGDVAGDRAVVTSATSGDTLITLSSTSVLNGTNTNGVSASALTGDITIRGSSGTIVGATNGIVSVTGGNLTIENIESVTGTSGFGLQLVTLGGMISVSDVAVVSGGDIGILADASVGGGDIAIENTGDVSGSNSGIVALTTGAGTITADLAGRTFGNTSGLDVFTDGGAVSITNRGTLSGGTWSLFASSANTGPITLNNTGTIDSPFQLASGNDSFTNSGTFEASVTSNFGAGTDSFDNTASGVLFVPTTALLTGLETTTNAGLITLVDGSAAGELILTGDFVGAGGTLALDIDFGTAADTLAVTGAVSGTNEISINDVTSTPGLGTPVVVVNGGAGSDAGAFVLADQTLTSNPFVAFDLTFDAANNDYLISRDFSSVITEATKLAEAAGSLWYRSTDAWVQHRSSTRFDADNQSPLWMTFYGNVADREDDSSNAGFMLSGADDLDYQQDYFGFQTGYDLLAGDGGFALGVTAGYLSSNLSFEARGNSARFDVFNLGLSASYNSGGFYADALVKYDTFSGDLTDLNPSGFTGETDGDAWGAHIQFGYRIGNDGFFVEPQVSVDYQQANLDDLDVGSSSFEFGGIDGLRGIAGLRIGGQSKRANGLGIGYYVGGSVVHEFEGDAPVRFVFGTDTADFANNPIDTFGRFEAGLTLFGTGPLSGFFEVESDMSSAYTSYGGSAGLRIKF